MMRLIERGMSGGVAQSDCLCFSVGLRANEPGVTVLSPALRPPGETPYWISLGGGRRTARLTTEPCSSRLDGMFLAQNRRCVVVHS